MPPPPSPREKYQLQEEQFELLLKTSQPSSTYSPLHSSPSPPLLPSISSPPPNEIVFNNRKYLNHQ